MKNLVSTIVFAGGIGFVLAVSGLGSGTMLAQETDEGEPAVPFSLSSGFEAYQSHCADCHGDWGKGTDQGPPLMHGYYVKGHHGDAAFFRAIQSGSPQHHWGFGDMPPVQGVNRETAIQIVKYIRWLQAENGFR